MDISRAYEVRAASEGGFVVSEISGPGYIPSANAAFSNASDLITWLAKQYGLPIGRFAEGGYSIPENMQQQVKVAIAAMSSAKARASEPLCEDEGCPHHGIDHVCMNWIEWNGATIFKGRETGVPCMVRMRNGKERVGKTFDQPSRWAWSVNDERLLNDVVAYRLV
ncbi:hypothetical protein EV128_12268 [Rhizobium azibense]|nr:hypothetical protein EV128_12268 [Rhizobium azibense]